MGEWERKNGADTMEEEGPAFMGQVAQLSGGALTWRG